MLTRCLRTIAPAALAVGAASLIGCSADRHTFSSTQMAPKSVDVTYIQSGETAWTYDIPPGQKLTLEFTRPGQFNGFKMPKGPADGMKWYLTGLGAGNDLSGHPGKFGAEDSGEIDLTGEPVQINVSLRDPDVPDETPAPIEVVPPPPAIDEIEEEEVEIVPPPAMEELPAEAPAAEPMMEEASDEVADTVEEVADEITLEAEEAADELTK